MYKCFKCGTEFEGNFCPNCGAKRKADITCRNCGAKSNASARFCTECGKSLIYEDTANNKANSKRSIIIGVVLIFAVVAAFIITILLCNLKSCGGDGDGTYYRLKGNGELDRTTYFILNSGKWEDEDGETGTYKIDGENITFYIEFFGEKDELCDGKLKDGVLVVNGDTFVTENSKENSSKERQSEIFTHTTVDLALEKLN